MQILQIIYKWLNYNKIKEARNLLHLSQEAFAEETDLTGRDISLLENGKKVFISNSLIQFLQKSGFDLNSLFDDSCNLVFKSKNTINAPPLSNKLPPQLPPQSKINAPPLKASEHKSDYKSLRSIPESWSAPKIITVNSEGQEAAVMIDIKAAAGLPNNIDNPKYYSAMPTIQLPKRQFSNGTHIVIQASGESMHPTIYHQDWIISRFDDQPAENMKDGYVYVIVSKSGVVIKRCLNRIKQRGMIVCQSDNSIGNPTYEIEIEDILQVYRAEAKLSFNLGNLNADLYKRLNNIEIEVSDLRKQIEKPKNEE